MERTFCFIKTIEGFKIEPFFHNCPYGFVFCTDAKYVKYLTVALQSLRCNRSLHNKYDVVLFVDGALTLSEEQALSGMNCENFNIRIFRVDLFVDSEFKGVNFVERDYWSRSMWHKCYIPLVMNEYERVLYCDCDIVFAADPHSLFSIDFKGKQIAAVRDSIVPCLFRETHRLNNLRNVMGLKNLEDYFNSGVVLYNIKKINVEHFRHSLFSHCSRRDLLYPDQDFLNIYFENNSLMIDLKYNCQANALIYTEDYLDRLTDEQYVRFTDAIKFPVVVHYIGDKKPWISSKSLFSDLFWSFARQSAFYEKILKADLVYTTMRSEVIEENSLYKFLKRASRFILPYGSRRRYAVKRFLGL